MPNNYFDKMVDVLLKNRVLGQKAIKAEFESEGTRSSELIRLKEVAHAAGVPLVVKIGGCEAIRDLIECQELRIANIVAPMIESKYAASKYIQALDRVFENDSFQPSTYINVETTTGFNNIESISNEISNKIKGIVMGRVDYVGSMGLNREAINSNSVLDNALVISKECLEKNLEFIIGGGISVESIDFLKRVSECHLTKFETRKCVFDARLIHSENINELLRNAVLFELLWLKSKQDFNLKITKEDLNRIEMLENRDFENKENLSRISINF